jgi:hypothetical protein
MTPAARWIGVVAVLAGTHACVYDAGRDAKQQQWDASIAKQAAATVKQVQDVQAVTQQTRDARAVVEKNLRRQIQTLQQRLVAYAQTPLTPCEPPPNSAAMFNAISGLFPDPHGVPSAAGPAGGVDESPETGIETTRLLLAYVQAYGDAARQLATLWHDYESLVSVLRNQHRLTARRNTHD